MKPIKTECPFHHTILEIGGHCKQCDYKIEKTYKNNFRFTKSEEDKDYNGGDDQEDATAASTSASSNNTSQSTTTTTTTTKINITMSNPHVRWLGGGCCSDGCGDGSAAVISYVRMDQCMDDKNNKGGSCSPVTKLCSETRVWENRDGKLVHVHFHKS